MVHVMSYHLLVECVDLSCFMDRGKDSALPYCVTRLNEKLLP